MGTFAAVLIRFLLLSRVEERILCVDDHRRRVQSSASMEEVSRHSHQNGSHPIRSNGSNRSAAN